MPRRGLLELFGANVRARRHQLGLSQEALAAKAGMHRTYVASLERGERNIGLDALVRLAAALEINPAELMKGL